MILPHHGGEIFHARFLTVRPRKTGWLRIQGNRCGLGIRRLGRRRPCHLSGDRGGTRKCRQSLHLKKSEYIICSVSLSITMACTSVLKTLSIDTATSRVSVALLGGDELRAEMRLSRPESRSALLLPSIEYLLHEAGWRLGDLNLIAAGTGPGSFTGIRIGLSTALGLAQSLRLPLAAISGLDALAFNTRCYPGRLGVALDAQRSQVYYAEYEACKAGCRRVIQPILLRPEDLGMVTRRPGLRMIGDGAVIYADRFRAGRKAWPRILEADLFAAAAIGRLALRRRHAWRTGAFLQAEPLYIRPPDAIRSKAGRKN
jgi:tRNA threonylcarbamoyladenosine biosynthesis protein TsaB